MRVMPNTLCLKISGTVWRILCALLIVTAACEMKELP